MQKKANKYINSVTVFVLLLGVAIYGFVKNSFNEFIWPFLIMMLPYIITLGKSVKRINGILWFFSIFFVPLFSSFISLKNNVAYSLFFSVNIFCVIILMSFVLFMLLKIYRFLSSTPKIFGTLLTLLMMISILCGNLMAPFGKFIKEYLVMFGFIPIIPLIILIVLLFLILSGVANCYFDKLITQNFMKEAENLASMFYCNLEVEFINDSSEMYFCIKLSRDTEEEEIRTFNSFIKNLHYCIKHSNVYGKFEKKINVFRVYDYSSHELNKPLGTTESLATKQSLIENLRYILPDAEFIGVFNKDNIFCSYSTAVGNVEICKLEIKNNK